MEESKYQKYDHKKCRELVNALLDYQANDTKNEIRREDNEEALTQLKIELSEVEKAKEWLNSLPLKKINALGEMEGALLEANEVLSKMNYNPEATNIIRLHHGIEHALKKAGVTETEHN